MSQNIALFNMSNGFVEALVRGYRLGFLTDEEFHNIAQCENLEDVKLNLQETDYGNFLQDEAGPISPSTIRDRALGKLVTEFKYLQAQADSSLSKFLEYIEIDFMIDNVMLILKATLSNPNVNIKDLMDQVHPLGTLPPEAMRLIAKFDNTPDRYADLYSAVLINTPVGKYFEQFLAEALASSSSSDGGGDTGNLSSTGDVRTFMEEDGTTKLENTIRKFYLEDFYNYCQNLGGETGQLMCELLLARADAIAISITLNSFGTSFNDESMEATRQSLYPAIGYLYPGATGRGCPLTRAHDEEQLGEALSSYAEYAEVLSRFVQGETTMDDAFYARETMLCELAFEGQFNYACFYAFVRLKEQEIRNLVWCCETIIQKQKSKMGQHYIPIFSRNSPWRTMGGKVGE